MPRGDKSKYTDKQERKADHIAEGYEKQGVSEKKLSVAHGPPSTRTMAAEKNRVDRVVANRPVIQRRIRAGR